MSNEQQHALHGLRAFYQGTYDESIRHLNSGTISPATLAVKAWCEIALAESVACGQSLAKIKQLEPQTTEDHLMLAQLYAWQRPEEAMRQITRAEQTAEIGVVGHLARAFVRVNMGLRVSDPDMVGDAGTVLESARVLYPTNEWLQEVSIFGHIAQAMVYRKLILKNEANNQLTRANEAEAKWRTGRGPSTFSSQLLMCQTRYVEACH